MKPFESWVPLSTRGPSCAGSCGGSSGGGAGSGESSGEKGKEPPSNVCDSPGQLSNAQRRLGLRACVPGTAPSWLGAKHNLWTWKGTHVHVTVKIVFNHSEL